MQNAQSPEFSLENPVSSAVEVVKAVLLRPREFFEGLHVKGSVKEPAIFTLLVGAFAGVLITVFITVFNLIFGEVTLPDFGFTALQALLLALLSPVLVGIVAAVYLLSIRTFIGKVGDFSEVYHIAAYAYSVMVLTWIPLAFALVSTYALMILMGLGIASVYRTSFLKTLITVLVGFVPCATGLILLRLAATLPFT